MLVGEEHSFSLAARARVFRAQYTQGPVGGQVTITTLFSEADNQEEEDILKAIDARLVAMSGFVGPAGPPGPPGPTGPQGAPGVGLFAPKTAAQSVVNSVVLVDDTEMVLALPANSRWVILSMLVYDAAGTPDVKFSLSGPSGATGVWHMSPQQAAGGGFQGADTHDLGQEQVSPGAGLGLRQSTMLLGHVIVGSTPGNLRIRWAQNTANANPSTVHPGSYLLGTRVA
jgi:hypothetical protein